MFAHRGFFVVAVKGQGGRSFLFDFLLAQFFNFAVPFVAPLHGPLKDSWGFGGDFGLARGTPVLHVRGVRGHGGVGVHWFFKNLKNYSGK